MRSSHRIRWMLPLTSRSVRWLDPARRCSPSTAVVTRVRPPVARASSSARARCALLGRAWAQVAWWARCQCQTLAGSSLNSSHVAGRASSGSTGMSAGMAGSVTQDEELHDLPISHSSLSMVRAPLCRQPGVGTPLSSARSSPVNTTTRFASRSHPATAGRLTVSGRQRHTLGSEEKMLWEVVPVSSSKRAEMLCSRCRYSSSLLLESSIMENEGVDMASAIWRSGEEAAVPRHRVGCGDAPDLKS
mmetsp:Transcript_69408/g.214657  ORF Transcript_69408/g.214657 Transcript_69408/m.214657 type:complete len:246 (+) Transcript_69408:1002-1739(+)